MVVLVGEGLERALCCIVTDHFGVSHTNIIIHRSVERGWALRGLLEHSELLPGNAQFLDQLVVGWLAAEFLGENSGDSTDTGQFVH